MVGLHIKNTNVCLHSEIIFVYIKLLQVADFFQAAGNSHSITSNQYY